MSMKKMLAVVAAASLVAVAAPAFAANPFSDVPMNHWAYDAVEELASKGVLEGYPNGTFKGSRAMTRYEIATMVARMMNAGLTGADLEKLKALVVEFQPELEALGVKVDGFDSRLSYLEKGLGGWNISGEMQFDYNSFDKDFDNIDDSHGWDFDSARLFLHRNLASGVAFDAEYGDGGFDRFYLTAEDFLGLKGLTANIGQFDIDYEGDDGLYYDQNEDAGFFQGLPYRGAQLTQDFGMWQISGFAASNVGDDGVTVYEPNESGEYYGARLKLNFSEKAWLSGNMYISKPGENALVGAGEFKSYWIGAGFKFGRGFEVKGAYYWEDIDRELDDDPNAWKVILAIDQEALKFTSLWAEYAKFDQGFITENLPYAFHASTADYVDEIIDAYSLTELPEMDVLFFALKQQWTEKWNTFERYVYYDPDGYDNASDFAVGIGYQYTPSLYFELAWNRLDTGDNLPGVFEKGDIIRFRTLLTF